MAKNKLRTEKELIKFLNNHGIAKRLKFLARTLMLTPKKFKFVFKYNKGSYTDGLDVHIGVPEYLVGHTKEEVFASLKALTAHEVEHINSTSFEGLKEFALKFGEYFNTKHGIHEGLAMRAGKYLDNAIEDGRIERLTTDRNKGLKKPVIYFRSLWWQSQDLMESYKSRGSYQELYDTLFAICCIATMGQLPLGYLDVYDDEFPELKDLLKKAKKYIYRCVDSDTPKEYYKRLWELVYILEDWLVEKFNELPDPEEAESTLEEMGKAFGEKSSSAHSTPKGGKMPSAPSPSKDDEEEEDEKGTGAEKEEEEDNSSDDTDNTESNENDEENEQSLRDMFKNMFGNKEDTFIEGDMKDIVKDAMRSCEEEIHEDEGDVIVQADIDDLKIRKEEASVGTESDIDSDSLTAIEEEYDKKAWKASLKIHRFNFPLLKADQSVTLTAKKIKKEFEEIFTNKVSRDVRNKKKGLLDTNSLYKISQKDYNCFMKKANPDKTDYVFYILVDGSGSMWGDKFVEAFRATAVLEECLGSLAPLKIVQFDCGGSAKVNHYIVKDFNDTKKGNYSTTFVHHRSANNGNMDGFSIRVATEEILKRNEQKKVLIILSDGLPAGSGSYYDRPAQTDVKDAIRYARKKHVEVFNIMFGSERERKELVPEFKYMYEKGIVSCDPSDIAKTLCKIVRKEIKK